MNKIKRIFSNLKDKIALKINKITKIKASKVADSLTLVAFFIIFLTTFMLNIYVGMYILAILLLICSYFIAK